MEPFTYVKVTKLGVVNDPYYKTAMWSEYKSGTENAKSPPIEYWITGELAFTPTIDQSVVVWRDNRNGVKMGGIFRTSLVKSIEVLGPKCYKVNTMNSVYLVEEWNKDERPS